MAKQNNQSITIIQEEDELVLPDKIVYPLQGAKTKEKTDEQPLRKYTPKPPINSQNTQPVTNDNADPLRTHRRGKKIVRPTISATLPGRPAARISPSSVKPKSDPVQMPLGFQCPQFPVQTYDEKARVDSDPVQHKVSKIRSNQGDEKTLYPQSLPVIRHQGNFKKSRAIAARTASVKRHENEGKRRTILSEVCKDVGGLPPRHELIMKRVNGDQFHQLNTESQIFQAWKKAMEERLRKERKGKHCWCTMTGARGLYVSLGQCLYQDSHLRLPPTKHLHRLEKRIQHQRRCLPLSTGLQFKSKVSLAKGKKEVKRDV